MADRFEILEETSHAPERQGAKEEADPALEKAMDALTVEDADVKDVKRASDAKEEGNGYFKEGRYLDALDCYSKALHLCPIDTEYAYNRAVYSNNRAACLFHLGRQEECIDDCSVAIELSPKYVKAYLRRAQAYEKLDKLEEALKDVKSVLEIDPTIQSAVESEKRLSAIVTERQEKMKAEMLEKLKGFGNTILGKFGLSTDNFQMVQDPATGSYNINFSQTKKP
ncbi:Mitochondrial Protein Translocase (MPT) Family [Achlya hypogyna]|uniref:Mitochondrial Protein Translocase (MPT) Family n=1 Tax=Achlya hypogyna TaxID=1202772 RepID=A0A1V9Z1J7_ACHHY|nr:Mitochondrial Protein Translocase (MPT) Family [Achlya hypogyna]